VGQGGGGCNSRIIETRVTKVEEEGYFEGQMHKVWGTWTLCHSVAPEEGQGGSF